MNIVFNVNPSGMEGLGATISSMLRNCRDSSLLKIYVLCSRLSPEDKNNINRLLKTEKFAGESVLIDYNANSAFGHLRDFCGDYTTYGKLLIPRLVPEDVVLYLDSDLIINLDVLELEGFDFQGQFLAAVYGSTVAHVLDRRFLIQKLSWSKDTPYFNAGVILFNLKQWRATDMDKKWEQLTHAYPNDFISHDQTIFNSLSEGRFAHLPRKFNVDWKPGKLLVAVDDIIVHFVGSPKPWDISGKFIHAGYDLWESYDTAGWKAYYCSPSYRRLRRAWNIRRSLLSLYPTAFQKTLPRSLRRSVSSEEA